MTLFSMKYICNILVWQLWTSKVPEFSTVRLVCLFKNVNLAIDTIFNGGLELLLSARKLSHPFDPYPSAHDLEK